MRQFFTVIARFIAVIFAVLFVITTILAILLTTINQQVFNSKLYKNALVKQNIYERLPEIVGVALTGSFFSGPCAQNQLACNIDGASPELKACLMTALGPVAYEAIGSGQRSPTKAELQLAQPCLDQYGAPQNSDPQPGTGGSGGMPSFLKNLTAADWQAILTILLPPDDLKTMTESTLDQMFAYLNGETDTVTVPLDKLKETLSGPAGTDLIMQLLNSQPPCTEQELAQMLSGTSEGGMVLCKPPEDMLPIAASILPGLLTTVVPQIPDQATIIKPPAPGVPPSGTGPFGADPITTLRTLRLIMRLSPLLPLAFLLLVTLFAVRSPKSWMRWWGIPFFVSGTIALGLGVSALLALNVVWSMFIVPRIPPYIPADLAGVGLELVRSIDQTISGWIILQAIILFVIGLAAWIGSTLLKTGKVMPVPPPPTPSP
jgi:hypothetical protein